MSATHRIITNSPREGSYTVKMRFGARENADLRHFARSDY